MRQSYFCYTSSINPPEAGAFCLYFLKLRNDGGHFWISENFFLNFAAIFFIGVIAVETWRSWFCVDCVAGDLMGHRGGVIIAYSSKIDFLK